MHPRILSIGQGFVLALVLALSARGLAADPQLEVNVNVAMTDEGRKISPPTKAKPAYYFPLVMGYREEGEKVAGETKPATKPIVHLLAKALAEQNYLVLTAEHPQPSLLLVFHWGYMNPEIAEFGVGEDSNKVFFNQREMVALLGGQTLGNLDLDFEREAVMQGAEDDRYFVTVSAYDFAAARQHKKLLLWQARMSTPSAGFTMAQVIPTLITSGGPQFGRESIRPTWVTAPAARQGKVEVGTPTVKEYLEPPPLPAPAEKPAK
jgi:hypothetical protein